MNIFVLDNDVTKAAQAHCDKHVVKMILESAQLLCGQFEKGDAPYKRSHYNHPCSIWCRESRANYLWLIEFGKALATEYTFRYNKTHKSLAVIEWCDQNIDKLKLPDEDMTGFAQAMPDEYRHQDAVVAYRTYYKMDKKDIAKWTKREAPSWFTKKS